MTFTFGFFVGISVVFAVLFFLKYWLDFATLEEQRKILEQRLDIGEKHLLETTRIRLHLGGISDVLAGIDAGINANKIVTKIKSPKG